MMVEKEIKVLNPHGLHARPASIFVKIANRFVSDITVCKDNESVNGKSIMGIMMLAANQGAVVKIQAKGADAEEAMRELEAFLMKADETGASEDFP